MTEDNGARIGIISYCDRLRTNAHVNHELYARAHGYTYIFDIAPTSEPPQHKKFFLKLEKIRKFLPLFDWLFWIDDDAFFMDRDVRIASFAERFPRATIVFCASPRTSDDRWTWMSSGTMLIRNTELGRRLLDAVMDTDLKEAKAWWDASEFGMWTGGDQDALVFQLATNHAFQQEDFAVRLDHDAFNNRPAHFTRGPFDHFVLHFTGADKGRQAADFAQKWGLSAALTEPRELDGLRGLFPAPVSAPDEAPSAD